MERRKVRRGAVAHAGSKIHSQKCAGEGFLNRREYNTKRSSRSASEEKSISTIACEKESQTADRPGEPLKAHTPETGEKDGGT